MKDQKNSEQNIESKSYFEKIEAATPVQVSQSIIAKIVKKINEDKKS